MPHFLKADSQPRETTKSNSDEPPAKDPVARELSAPGDDDKGSVVENSLNVKGSKYTVLFMLIQFKIFGILLTLKFDTVRGI